RASGAAARTSARVESSPIFAASESRRRRTSNTRLPIAARSPEPAKRCALPQSARACAAGRWRTKISSSTSTAAFIRAPGRIDYNPSCRVRQRSSTHVATRAMKKAANPPQRTTLMVLWITRDTTKSKRTCDNCRSAVAWVVRAFTRDANTMNMALANRGLRDANELGFCLQLRDAGGANVAHPSAQSADELVQHSSNRSLVRYLALDTLRYEFQGILHLLLEVAVSTATCHGPNRSHAAVGFVCAPFVKVGFSGALIRASQQRADHHGISSSCRIFGDIPGELYAAVRNDVYARLSRLIYTIAYSSQLGDSSA